MRVWVFLLLLLGGVHFCDAQYTVTGVVQDAGTAEPLIGASVTIHELSRGTITDISGRFSFEGLRAANYHFHVSYVGYTAHADLIKVSGDAQLVFSLEPTSIELSEIVVESNHYKTGPKEHTLSMEIIDADYLKQNRKGTFVNSLEDLPGISAINTGVGISKPVIRGMSFNRVIVNDRGVKQEGQQWGTDHGLEIDMFDPGRVEVIKGPGSLLYGSDGLGGVINVLPPALPQSGAINGSVQTLYKSNNHLFGTSTMVEGHRGDFVFRARVSTQDFGDYRVPAETFTYNSYNLSLYDQRLKNTAGNERNFSVMAGIKKSWGYSTVTVSNFHQRAGFFVGAIGIPRSYQLEPDGNTRNIALPRQEINHFKIISNTNILIGKNWAEVDLGYQQNYRTEQSNPHAHGKGPRPEGTLAHGLKLHTWSLNARYFQQQSKRHTRIFGLQAQNQVNSREGFEFLLPAFRSFSVGSFVYEELSWADKYTLTGGLRFDFANRDITRFEEPIYSDASTIERYYTRNPDIQKEFYNFSGAVGFSFYPVKEFNAKLNIGTSYRVPSSAELSMNGIHHGTFRHEVGDSTLTSERGIQGDLGLSFQNKNLSITVTPFMAFYNDFIYLAPTAMFSSGIDSVAFPEGGQVFRYRQHDAFFGGGELAAEYHPIEPLHLRTAVEYVYNYNFDTKLPLPFTPPLSIFSEANYHFPAFPGVFSETKLGVTYKRVFAQNRVDRNERVTPGYHLVGLNAGTTLTVGDFSCDLLFSVQNLTDARYFNHLSRYRLLNLPEQGRNFVISLNIPFAIK